MLAFLVTCAAVVGLALVIFFAFRACVGRVWLERLVLGIQQFDGFRPRWHDLASLSKSHTGEAALIGSAAVATEDFRLDGSTWRGRVRVGAELWSACSTAPVASGETRYVAEVEGLTLVIAPTEPAA